MCSRGIDWTGESAVTVTSCFNLSGAECASAGRFAETTTVMPVSQTRLVAETDARTGHRCSRP